LHCSLVALGNKMGQQHIHKMLEQMCNKIVPHDEAPRKKDHNDSTFIGLKALVTDIPDMHGALVASTCTPILVRGLDRDVRLHRSFSSRHCLHTV
jgi:hypothetical protein